VGRGGEREGAVLLTVLQTDALGPRSRHDRPIGKAAAAEDLNEYVCNCEGGGGREQAVLQVAS
jgi:hypothetical protein